MKIITILTAFLLVFSTISFAQELTPKQKEVLEEMKKKAEEEKAIREAIEKKLGLYKPKTEKKEEDKSAIPKDIVQNRDLSKYLDGDSIYCGNFFSGDPFTCDFTKLREFVWNSWYQKKLSYFSWGFCGRDTCYTEYFFIEPNKKGQWQIARYSSSSYFADKTLPTVFIVEWGEDKGENKLFLKDKSGKVIDKY